MAFIILFDSAFRRTAVSVNHIAVIACDTKNSSVSAYVSACIDGQLKAIFTQAGIIKGIEYKILCRVAVGAVNFSGYFDGVNAA